MRIHQDDTMLVGMEAYAGWKSTTLGDGEGFSRFDG